MRRRLGFVRRAALRGLAWGWQVVSHVGTAITLLAILAAVSVTGVALGRPWWLIGGGFVLLVLVAFVEGAYRVWDETERELREVIERDTPEAAALRSETSGTVVYRDGRWPPRPEGYQTVVWIGPDDEPPPDMKDYDQLLPVPREGEKAQ